MLLLLQRWAMVVKIVYINIEEGEEKLKRISKKRRISALLFYLHSISSEVRRSIASLAASCSASFFLWAVPFPRK